MHLCSLSQFLFALTSAPTGMSRVFPHINQRADCNNYHYMPCNLFESASLPIRHDEIQKEPLETLRNGLQYVAYPVGMSFSPHKQYIKCEIMLKLALSNGKGLQETPNKPLSHCSVTRYSLGKYVRMREFHGHVSEQYRNVFVDNRVNCQMLR